MTSDPTTWADLKTSLANWLNRDDLSTTEIPEAIAFAERRFNRVLRMPEMEDVQSAPTTAGTITLPTDFMQLRAVHLNTNPKVVLEQMTLATLRHAYPDGATGQPVNYALQSGNELVFGPSPDTTYTIIINYWKTIPALGSGQATNWLLTAHPDAYLHGALFELFSLTMDEQRAAYHEGKLNGILEEIKTSGRNKAIGSAPIRIRSAVVV